MRMTPVRRSKWLGRQNELVTPIFVALLAHAHDHRGDAAPRRRVVDRIARIEKPGVAEDCAEHPR